MSEPAPDLESFSERLLALLNGLKPDRSQAWLAKESGLSTSAISRLISGSRSPNLETAECLAPIFGLTVPQLLRGTDAANRLDDLNNYVHRKDYEALVCQIAEYEMKINSLEAQVEQANTNYVKERENRIQSNQKVSRLEVQCERDQTDIDDLRRQIKHLEKENRRYIQALQRAITDIARLKTRLREIHEELKKTNRTGKINTLLAGIAALTGVVTANYYLRSEPTENAEEDDD